MISRVFLALSLLLWQVLPSAAMLTITELSGFNAGGVLPSIDPIVCTSDGTDTNSYTFSSHDVGTAGSNRKTIIGIAGQDGATSFNVSSVTVGGDSATEVVDEGGSGTANTAIYILDNPSGTAEDIVVTFSESILAAAVCVWAAYDLNSSTAVDTAADDDGSSGELLLDLDTSANGLTVGYCTVAGTGETATWSGLTTVLNSGVNLATNAADLTEDGSATAALDVGCNFTGTLDASGVTATFR